MLSRQRRLQSSLHLLIEAWRVWGKAFENDELLWRVEEVEKQLDDLDLCDCPEAMVSQVEAATLNLINNMDDVLKSLGSSGVYFDSEYKH